MILSLKRSTNIWFVLLIAFIVFPLKLHGNLRYLTYGFIYLLPVVFLFFNYDRVISLLRQARGRWFQIFNLIVAYLLLISAILPLAFGTFDFSYLTSYWSDCFLWFIKYLFLVIVFERFVDPSRDIKLFVDYFAKAVSLYVAFSVIVLLIPTFRDHLINILYFSESDLLNVNRPEYWTRFGWSGWSGFNETAICTIAIVFNGMLLLNSKTSKDQRKYILLSILPLIGNALYGRIGLLTSVSFLGMAILYSLASGNLKIIFRVLIAFAVAIILFIHFREQFSFLNDWYNWVFSAFENYSKTGKLYDNIGTIQHLTSDMYWMPDIDTLLFGDGRYFESDGSYYMHTDAGIMRQILFYGVVNYLLSLAALYFLVKTLLTNILDNTKYHLFFSIMVFVVIGIFEFKGESLWMFAPVFLATRLLLPPKNNYPKRNMRSEND